MGMRGETCIEKKQADLLVTLVLVACLSLATLRLFYQNSAKWHLSFNHPSILEWCSHYYLCTNLSYTSHLQLYIV